MENLTPSIVLLLNLLFKVFPYAQLGLSIAFIIAGISFVCSALLLCFRMPQPWSTLTENMEQAIIMSGAENTKLSNILPLLQLTGKCKDVQDKEHFKQQEMKVLLGIGRKKQEYIM